MPDRSNKLIHLTVVVGSPSDVKPERDQVRDITDRVNKLLGVMKSPYRLEVKDQSGVRPHQGNAQEVAQYYLNIRECDIFISIVWHRFGEPPGTQRADGSFYRSGTEEEVEIAFDANRENGGRAPVIMIYRKTDPLPPVLSDAEHMQYGDLLHFLEECKPGGRHPCYVYNFRSDSFSENLEEHLLGTCAEIEKSKRKVELPGLSHQEDQPGQDWLDKVGLTQFPFREVSQMEESLLAKFPNVDLHVLREMLTSLEPGFIFGAWGTGKSTLRMQIESLSSSSLSGPMRIYPLHFTETQFNDELERLPGGWKDYKASHFLRSLAKIIEENVVLTNPGVKSPFPDLDFSLPGETIAYLRAWLKQVSSKDFILCLVDNLDEISQVKSSSNPPGVILHLLEQIAALPSGRGFLVRFFLPASIEPFLEEHPTLFRLDKGPLVRLEWVETGRLDVIARRMDAASDGNIHSIGELFDPSQGGEALDTELVELSGTNLRALLWLARRLFQLHMQIKPSPPDQIMGSTWEQVKAEWPRERARYYPDALPIRRYMIKDGAVVYKERSVHLTPTELRLLEHLNDYIGEVCTRQVLARAGWPEYDESAPASSDQIYEVMRKLKKKMNDMVPNAIENISHQGYRLNPPEASGDHEQGKGV